MITNYLILFSMVGLAVFLGWLTRKAWMVKSPLVRWLGILLSGVLALLLAAVSIVGLIGIYRFSNPPYNPVKEIKVVGTPEQLSRGQHLAAALCAECHSTTNDFPLTGGVDMSPKLPIDLGTYYSANLTPSGPLKDWTDGEIFRALRDNVDKDGKRLVSMAGTNVRFISDEDMLALIAFLRSTEPMENEVPEPFDQPNFHALLLTGANRIQDRPLISGPIVAPEKEATAEYGQFLVSFLGCQTCHGEDLKGGTDPLRPKGPTLRIVRGGSHDGFILAMRTGFTHTGRPMEPTMPWKSFGRLDDTELTALYQYLITLE